MNKSFTTMHVVQRIWKCILISSCSCITPLVGKNSASNVVMKNNCQPHLSIWCWKEITFWKIITQNFQKHTSSVDMFLQEMINTNEINQWWRNIYKCLLDGQWWWCLEWLFIEYRWLTQINSLVKKYPMVWMATKLQREHMLYHSLTLIPNWYRRKLRKKR